MTAGRYGTITSTGMCPASPSRPCSAANTRGGGAFAFGAPDFHGDQCHRLFPIAEVEMLRLGPASLIERLRIGVYRSSGEKPLPEANLAIHHPPLPSPPFIPSRGEFLLRCPQRLYATARYCLLTARGPGGGACPHLPRARKNIRTSPR